MAVAAGWQPFSFLLLSMLASISSAGASASAHHHLEEQPAMQDDDFIVALSSATSRLALAQATRAYRAGIRTLIMTDNETMVPHLNKVYGKYREAYEFFPDEQDQNSKKWHAKNPGDFRAAVAPFVAHRLYGDDYKWMLYGDDDTVFFMPGVRKLVSQFDHNLPIALSDNLWYDASHPRLEAYRCLPCGFEPSPRGLPRAQNATGYAPRAACPFCTPAHACPPSSPDCTIGAGAHGGAGMIFSVGLMRKLLYDDALACMNSLYHCSGGDCLVSQCIWRAGVAFTDPGVSLLYDDPYSHILFDSLASRWFLRHPIEQIYLGNCNDDVCDFMVRNAVSFHMRGKSYPSFPKAAAALFGLVESHAAATEFLDILEDVASRPAPRGEASASAPGAALVFSVKKAAVTAANVSATGAESAAAVVDAAAVSGDGGEV